jgi:hypothetical protein
MQKISKKLSANDIGTTGSHQAGILVPKERSILSFFPALSRRTKNPRTMLSVREKPHGTTWQFNFIYYNNKLFQGTRNEYRLTGMTSYLRAVNASVGDELVFSKDENGTILVECVRSASQSIEQSGEILVLKSGWKSIPA